ncbi:MAG: glycosyltransferase family 4 protein [Flavobacterium sp.]|nr:glycosyltransferase family 4 protein [Flavobacterium sp.]
MQNSKILLVIGFVFPEPKSSAAGNRMMQLLDLFLSAGYTITFASTAQNLEFSEDLISLGISTQIIELNSETFNHFIINLNPNIVLFDRFMVEEQFGWRISENCPKALRILDTEDLHSLRLSRQKAVIENRDFVLDDLFKSDYAKREIASIYRCDVSLFVSEFEIDTLKSIFQVPENLLYYLPIFASKIEDEIPSFEHRSDFIFIGNFLHEPNWDCVLYLSETIFPKIREVLPQAKMLVYGAYCSQKVLQLHKPKNNFYIMQRAENAFEVVKKARVVLVPLRFGAGIKGKLLEAMQCGTPSVTTVIGAESMQANLSWNGFVENNVEQFVAKATKLYQDETVWNKMQGNGFEILKKLYSKVLFQEKFIAKIDSMKVNITMNRKKNYVGILLQSQQLASTKYMSKWIEAKNRNK